MPHQCVRCGTLYEDGAKEILQGCSCGARLFFFISKNKLKRAEEIKKLSKQEKKEIEKDVMSLIDVEKQKDKPIILDLESVNISKPGKYELDIERLFKKEPLIFKLEEGKYVIDLPESFKKLKTKK